MSDKHEPDKTPDDVTERIEVTPADLDRKRETGPAAPATRGAGVATAGPAARVAPATPVAGEEPASSHPPAASQPPAATQPPITTQPSAAGPAATRPQGPRVGTIVWGLVVLAIGLGVMAAAAGARIDVGLAAILLLGGAGVALVAGSIVSSFRRRTEADPSPTAR